MQQVPLFSFLKDLTDHMPKDWLRLTTHRLDIYQEDRAKSDFLERLEGLYQENKTDTISLSQLPTAYDYIRLGHPLSSILEWSLAKITGVPSSHVISFSSANMPLLAVLRKNKSENRKTRIVYSDHLPSSFDPEVLRSVYGYSFETLEASSWDHSMQFEGSTVYLTAYMDIVDFAKGIQQHFQAADFVVGRNHESGSILLAHETTSSGYISEIQHVRRRESIAMTPQNSYLALQQLIGEATPAPTTSPAADKKIVLQTIREVTATETPALLGSSGLSIQYAIMMGLIDHAKAACPGKPVRFLIPPNCYGGTNDQARRVAACIDQVAVLDLPVDREHNMVDSLGTVLDQVAAEDAVPFIIVEIPTNPRVEVPVVKDLRNVLNVKRKTPSGEDATSPVFIIDQTFCPNFPFLRQKGAFPDIKTLIYVSGSKFPSGGKCTAGYCTANKEAADYMPKIEQHLMLCDNEATDLQVALLAEQMPTMIQRIEGAYQNTRAFVNFIKQKLPEAKINFVSEELAKEGFTPSVFSLDLPTKGDTHEERESYKRALNLKLIKMMIDEIPDESKYCVSYGQLKGCYWTIPATSTQGTTKEADKDYIARVAVSPDLDLDRHKEVFERFIMEL